MMKNYRAELTGDFGDPVDDNPTGVVEEAAYAAKGLNYRYLTIKVLPEDLVTAIRSVRAMHMKGINLTMPHKIAVIPYLDELSQAAGIIGAVNTVINKDGRLIGENSDGKGFVSSLTDDGVSMEGKVVTILGAGGAARAIAIECALAGARTIHLINRTPERGEELSRLISSHTPAQSDAGKWEAGMGIPEDTQILINATSIGLVPDADALPDIDYDTISEDMVVSDVVFNPAVTRFLKEAAKRGARTVSGLGMLACQGALNFTLWTGKEAPLDVLENKLREEFGQL